MHNVWFRTRLAGAWVRLWFLAVGCSDTAAPPPTSPTSPSQSGVIAALSIAPKSITIPATEIVQFTATVRNGLGAEVRTSIEWSSSGGAIDDSGRFVSQAEGQFTVVARLRDIPTRADSGLVIVSLPTNPPDDQTDEPKEPGEDPDQAALELNRPAGFITIADLGFDSRSIGWAASPKWSDPRYLVEVQDSSGPRSGPGALEFAFPAGFQDVASPARAGTEFKGHREIYVAYWVKVSRPWQFHRSGVNKLFFVGTNASGKVGNEMVVTLRGTGESSAQVEIAVQSPANQGMGTRNGYYTANMNRPGFSIGAWHLIEVLAVGNSAGAADGNLRWWVDGSLVGHHANVVFKEGAEGLFNGFTLDPNWGGQGSPPKAQRDWIRVDHLTVAGR